MQIDIKDAHPTQAIIKGYGIIGTAAPKQD